MKTYLAILMLLATVSSSTAVCHTTGFKVETIISSFNNKSNQQETSSEQPMYTHDILICNNSKLTRNKPLPSLETGYDAKILKFLNSKIEEIPVGTLKKFSKLEEIYFNNSYVKNIEPGSFSNLNYLKKLYLNNNLITYIHNGTFSNLDLKFLNLSYNNLKYITENIFKDISNITVLDMSNNNLEKFSMSDNNRIYSLNLCYNKINKINFSQLKGNVSLEHNNLEVLTNCGPDLIHLNLENNHIKHIQHNIFSKSINLLSLSLNYNHLETIDSDAFVGLENLQILIMSYNNILTIEVGTFRELSKLKYLNISSNRIKSIEYGTFTNLNNLISFDISYNKISSLDPYTLYPLINLENLFLNDNNLKNHIIIKLPNLKFISIHNNYIPCTLLSELISYLSEQNITIIDQNSLKTNNINGIACTTLSEIHSEKIVDNTNITEDTIVINEIKRMANIMLILVILVVVLIVIKLVGIYQKFTYIRRRKLKFVENIQPLYQTPDS